MNSKQVVSCLLGLALGLGDFSRRLWLGGAYGFRYYAGSGGKKR